MISKEPIIKIKKTENVCSKKSKVILLVSFAIFVTTLLGQLFITNTLAVKGKEIVVLENSRAEIQREISILELERSKFSSMKHIEEEAQKMGFVKNIKYDLSVSSTVTTASLNTF